MILVFRLLSGVEIISRCEHTLADTYVLENPHIVYTSPTPRGLSVSMVPVDATMKPDSIHYIRELSKNDCLMIGEPAANMEANFIRQTSGLIVQ